mgnify:CR=1 FL=1
MVPAQSNPKQLGTVAICSYADTKQHFLKKDSNWNHLNQLTLWLGRAFMTNMLFECKHRILAQWFWICSENRKAQLTK